MEKGVVYTYMYDANSDKLKFLNIIGRQYKFHNLTSNTIELLPKAALQGLIKTA